MLAQRSGAQHKQRSTQHGRRHSIKNAYKQARTQRTPSQRSTNKHEGKRRPQQGCAGLDFQADNQLHHRKHIPHLRQTINYLSWNIQEHTFSITHSSCIHFWHALVVLLRCLFLCLPLFFVVFRCVSRGWCGLSMDGWVGYTWAGRGSSSSGGTSD